MPKDNTCKQLAFTFRTEWGPVHRNVERCCSRSQERCRWCTAPQTGEPKTIQPRVKSSSASVREEKRSGERGRPTCGGLCRVQMQWVSLCLSLSVSLSRSRGCSRDEVEERPPEWCSPLQQLSATEQKSALQALYSNSRRGREREREREREGWRRRGGGGGYVRARACAFRELTGLHLVLVVTRR